MDFAQADLLRALQAASPEELDALDFGVIGLDAEGRVVAYNRCESDAAGLLPERVLGRRFFAEVAPCMDNSLVAGRLAAAEAVDVLLDYVFALQMRPEPVVLRLLKPPVGDPMYVLVQRGPRAG